MNRDLAFLTNIISDTVKEELYIENNPLYIPNFFTGNVTSVTGVIGANGAGKSNLFELLKYTLGSFQEGMSAIYEGLASVVVFEKEIFFQRDLKIKNLAMLKEMGFTVYMYKDSLAMHYDENGVRQNLEMGSGNIYTNGHIYYSNIFDGRSDDYLVPESGGLVHQNLHLSSLLRRFTNAHISFKNSLFLLSPFSIGYCSALKSNLVFSLSFSIRLMMVSFMTFYS